MKKIEISVLVSRLSLRTKRGKVSSAAVKAYHALQGRGTEFSQYFSRQSYTIEQQIRLALEAVEDFLASAEVEDFDTPYVTYTA
jgi:pyridoxine/pyridoxamine 5'-phosphate oxidase